MLGELTYISIWVVLVGFLFALRKQPLARMSAVFMMCLAISFPFFTSNVAASNTPPNVQGIPDVAYYRNSDVINLDDYVTDPDNPKPQLVWTIRSTNGNQISATIDADNKLTFTTAPPTQATEVFEVTATDPGGLNDSDIFTVQSSRFEDGGEACKSQLTDSNLLMVDLGDEANALEQIIYVFYALCMTIAAIDLIAATLNTLIIGSVERGPPECRPYTACGGHPYCSGFLALCSAIDQVYRATAAVYGVTKYFCCFITCGWCSSYSKESQVAPDAAKSGSSVGCPAPFGAISTSVVSFTGVSVDPFENIYSAMACMCPVAILMNLRKMRTIYSVYECCVSQACEQGFDKQICENYLKEAECMYLTAAWQKTLVGVLVKMIIPKLLITVGADKAIDLSGPISAWIRLGSIPFTIMNLIDIWSFVGKTFTAPEGAACQTEFQDYFKTFYTFPSYATLNVPEVGGDGWKTTSGDRSTYDMGNGWRINHDSNSGEYTTVAPNGEPVFVANKMEDYAKKVANENAATDAVWHILNLALNNWAYPAIDQQCKDETQSSRPQHSGPVAVVTSQSIGQTVNCNGLNSTAVQASGTIEKLGGSLFEAKVSYSITNCNATEGAINYALFLNTPITGQDQILVATALYDEIHGGTLSKNYSSNYSIVKFETSAPYIDTAYFNLTVI